MAEGSGSREVRLFTERDWLLLLEAFLAEAIKESKIEKLKE